MGQKPHRICIKNKGNDGKERWSEIGVAFSGEKGMSLIFNARIMVTPQDGIMVFPPRDRAQNDRVTDHQRQAEEEPGYDPIPF